MANKSVHLPIVQGTPPNLRKDAWWAGPSLTVVVLLGFVVYATLRAFEGAYYQWQAYLSPFYSPFFDTSWAKSYGLGFFTPAMLILPGPASFRFTCYYYRKAYYRSFVGHPRACAMPEGGSHSYNGETKLMVFQNLHRFTMYVAVVFLVILWKDAVEAFVGWQGGVHCGVGSLVMLANVILLSGYTFGCHSFRHLIGGGVNSYSKAAMGGARFSLWKLVTVLNERHQPLAWASLFSVALTDVYIRAVATGAIVDVRLF
jgi:hypothetical protein